MEVRQAERGAAAGSRGRVLPGRGPHSERAGWGTNVVGYQAAIGVLLPGITLQAKFQRQRFGDKGVFIQKPHNFAVTVSTKISCLVLSIKAKLLTL